MRVEGSGFGDKGFGFDREGRGVPHHLELREEDLVDSLVFKVEG